MSPHHPPCKSRYLPKSHEVAHEEFLRHCEWWYDIHISVPLPVLESLTPAKNRLLRLQRLSLDVQLFEFLGIFQCAPRLRWLKLDSSLEPSLINAPWNQNRVFRHGNARIDHTLELLRATPNLKECVIKLISSEPRRSHFSVELLHLRSMTISGNPTYFFDTLLLPKLKKSPLISAGLDGRLHHNLLHSSLDVRSQSCP